MNNLKEEIERYFYIDGFNCAETTFKILYDNGYVKNADENTIKMLTGFGGGVTKGSICGAVAAAVMAFGSIYGRTRPEQPREISKKIIGSYLDKFIDEYGSINCEKIIKDFTPKTKEQYEYCKKVINSSITHFITVINDSRGAE
jgi:C_GCAxxG_C_C family probable redox protein